MLTVEEIIAAIRQLSPEDYERLRDEIEEIDQEVYGEDEEFNSAEMLQNMNNVLQSLQGKGGIDFSQLSSLASMLNLEMLDPDELARRFGDVETADDEEDSEV
jgi:hypothetical protein